MRASSSDAVGPATAPLERLGRVGVATGPEIATSLHRVLDARGYDVRLQNGPEPASSESVATSVVLAQLSVVEGAGWDRQEWIRAVSEHSEVIVVAEEAALEAAIGAVRAGAYGFVLFPFRSEEEIVLLVGKAAERRELMKRALLQGPGHGPPHAAEPGQAPTWVGSDPASLLPYREAKQQAVSAFDAVYFAHVLRSTGGNVSEAARRSGLDRSNFRRALKRAGLTPSRQ